MEVPSRILSLLMLIFYCPIDNTLRGRKDIRIDNIPPQITQSSINNNGNIPVLYNSKIIYTVSEKVQSADLNMTSALGDIVNGTLSVMNANQSSSVDLDLLAPFTSGDAIQVTIENLTDLAGMYLKTLNMNTMFPLLQTTIPMALLMLLT